MALLAATLSASSSARLSGGLRVFDIASAEERKEERSELFVTDLLLCWEVFN